MNKTNKIQRPYGRALGDCWSVINYFINYGLENNELINMSLWYQKGHKIKRADKIKDILSLLEHNEYIQVGEWKPTENKLHWNLGSAYPHIPTKMTWEPNESRQICYQFDGKSKKGQKNFGSIEEAQNLVNYIQNLGFKTVQVGGNKTLEHCVQDMAESEAFIGIDSGMCYMAASVGVPMVLVQNNTPMNRFTSSHSNKHFILCTDGSDAINKVHELKHNGLDYYINKAENIHWFQYYVS